MRLLALVLVFAWFGGAISTAQTSLDVQPVVELVPNGTLATCFYKPVDKENPFFSRLSPKEKTNDALFGDKYKMHGKKGKYVGWFGIVRGIKPSDQPGGEVTLLVQHHFFDGETECHIMLVSKSGDGDFLAKLKTDPTKLPPLSLVRVYGKVTAENEKVPEVAVEYSRIWPWMTFTFTDLGGEDHSNSRWAQFAKVKLSDRLYVPYPKESYYPSVLGDPSQFGLNFKFE